MKIEELILVKFVINDREVKADVPPDMNLMQFLRRDMGLVGTKNGCESGHCGTCTVIVDGVARRACLVKMKKVEGANIETIEGLSENGDLHPLQQAFIETGAVQCGYCTPGMIMSAKVLLEENPDPSEEDIREGISGNFCRCTGYTKIFESISAAADAMKGGE